MEVYDIISFPNLVNVTLCLSNLIMSQFSIILLDEIYYESAMIFTDL